MSLSHKRGQFRGRVNILPTKITVNGGWRGGGGVEVGWRVLWFNVNQTFTRHYN